MRRPGAEVGMRTTRRRFLRRRSSMPVEATTSSAPAELAPVAHFFVPVTTQPSASSRFTSGVLDRARLVAALLGRAQRERVGRGRHERAQRLGVAGDEREPEAVRGRGRDERAIDRAA